MEVVETNQCCLTLAESKGLNMDSARLDVVGALQVSLVHHNTAVAVDVCWYTVRVLSSAVFL